MSELDFIILDEEPPKYISLEALIELTTIVDSKLDVLMMPHMGKSSKLLYAKSGKNTTTKGIDNE